MMAERPTSVMAVLDHVLASGRNVNVLVLGLEGLFQYGRAVVQAAPMKRWRSLPRSGEPTGKKDLAMMAMTYGNVYVAQVAMGASDRQTVQA